MKKMLPVILFLTGLLASNIALAQPANDACNDAIAVGLDTIVNFSTVGATEAGPFHPLSNCANGVNDSIFNDIWYSFTAPVTGNILWNLCGYGTDFDSRVAIYQANATCPLTDGDLLDCNEDGPSACANFESQLLFPAIQGATYLLRLGGYGETAPGAEGMGGFTLKQVASPANDFCANAEVIGFVTDKPVNTVGAATDGPAHPGNDACFGFGDDSVQADVWFSFTAQNDGFVEWSTCNTIFWDSRMAVYEDAACPPMDSDLYACNDDGGGCQNYTSKLGFNVKAGSTYLLRLGGYDGETGQGTFSLTDATPPEPPANDLCENADSAWVISQAVATALDVIHEGTTVDATYDIDNWVLPNDDCFPFNPGGQFSDVWWKFNTNGNTELDIVFNRIGDTGAFILDMFTDCGTPVDTTIIKNSCILSSEGDPTPIINTVTGFSADPTDYYIRVTTRLTTELPGDFFIQIIGAVPTATVDPVLLLDYNLFPNPAGDDLHLTLTLQEPLQSTFSIVNMLGSQMYLDNKQTLSGGSHQMNFDIQNLPAGIYFLVMNTNKGSRGMRFVKR